MKPTNKTASKTFSCPVTYTITEGSFLTDYTATIKSPKTGNVLSVSGRAFTLVPSHVMSKVVTACGCKTGSGIAKLTREDILHFMDAQEEAKEERKAAMMDDDVMNSRKHSDGRVCTAGDEEMDGFCEACEDEIVAAKGHRIRYQLFGNQGGL
jgi:hypothetical protein